jgi:translocation and assembly module TamB
LSTPDATTPASPALPGAQEAQETHEGAGAQALPLQAASASGWQRARRILLLLALLPLLLFGVLCFVLGREASVQALLPYLARQIPGAQVQLSGIHGSLWGPLRIEKIEYRDAKQQLSIEQIQLDWQPWQLWRKRLVLSQVQIGRLAGRTLQASGARLPQDLSLPLALDIEQLQCRVLEWQDAANRWQFERLQLGLHDLAGYWQLEQASVQTPWGKLALDGKLAQRGELAVQARGMLEWMQAQQAIRLDWQLGGTLQQLRLRGQSHAIGGVWQAELDVRPFDVSPNGVEPHDAGTNPGLPLTRLLLRANHINPARIGALPQADLTLDLLAEQKQGQWQGHVQIDNALPGPLSQARLPLRRLHSLVSGQGGQLNLPGIVADFGAAGQLGGRLAWRADQANQIGLHLKASRINLQAWHETLRASNIGGELNWSQTGPDAQFQADLAQDGLKLVLAARLAQQRLQVEQARLQVAGGELQWAGELALAAPGRFVGTGNIRHFNPAQLGRFAAGDINGSLRSAGQWAKPWQLDLKAQLGKSQWFGQPWDGHINLQLHDQRVSQLDLDLHAGRNGVRASGALGQAGDQVAWQFDLLDPGWLGWAGNMHGAGRLSGDAAALQSTVLVQVNDWRKNGVAGVAEAGQASASPSSLQAQGQIQLDLARPGPLPGRLGGTLTFDFTHLNPARWGAYPLGDLNGKGELRLDQAGQYGVALDLATSRWQGQALYGHARGQVSPSQWQGLDVALVWGARQLNIGQQGERVRWRFEYGAAGVPAAGVPAAGVPAAGVPAAGVPAAGVPAAGAPASAASTGLLMQGELKGNPAAHQLSLQANWQGVATELTLEGGWNRGSGWQGSLLRWQNLPGSPLWRMQAPSTLQYVPDTGQLLFGSSQFVFDGGQLTLNELALGSDGWRSRGHVNGLPLAVLPWLQPQWRSYLGSTPSGGMLRFAGQWQIEAGEQLNGNLKLSRESGDWQPGPEWPQGLGLQQLQLELALQQNALKMRFAIEGLRIGQAQLQLATQLARQGGQWGLPGSAALQMSGTARIDSLAPLAGFGKGQFQCDGRVQLQMNGSGSVANPQFTGSVTAEQLRFDWIAEGLHLRNGALHASWRDDRLIVQDGHFDGLKAQGWLALSGAKPSLHLQLDATKLPVVSRPDRELVLSGQTTVDLSDKGFFIGGQLAADHAAIELRTDDSPVVSDDIRLYRGQVLQEKPNPTLPVNVKLGFDLGSDFHVKGQGLDTRLAGKLQLQALERRGPRLYGSVQVVDGSYQAYGQKLKIDEGEINFSGVWDNPGLHLTAWRQKVSTDSEVEVGVELRGTLLSPRVRLVSNPALPDSEKLAWLVLGHGIEGSAGQELDVLGAASSALFGSTRDRVANRLGLDEFGVSYAKGVENAVFTLGKRLSQRAFLSFEQGVGSATGLVKLRYTLNPRLSIQVQTGSNNAADVFYSWRFD